MSEVDLIQKERRILRFASQLNSEYARELPLLLRTLQAEEQRLQLKLQDALDDLEEEYLRNTNKIAREHERKRKHYSEKYEEDLRNLKKRKSKASEDLALQISEEKERVLAVLQEGIWTCDASLDVSISEANRRFHEIQERLNQARKEMESLRKKAHEQIQAWKKEPDHFDQLLVNRFAAKGDPSKLDDFLQNTRQKLSDLRGLFLPLIKGIPLLAFITAIWLALILPLGSLTANFLEAKSTAGMIGLGAFASGVVAFNCWIILSSLLEGMINKQILQKYQSFAEDLNQCEKSEKTFRKQEEEETAKRIGLAREIHKAGVDKARKLYDKSNDDISNRERMGQKPLEEWYKTQNQNLEQKWQDRAIQLDQETTREREEARSQFEKNKQRFEQETADKWTEIQDFLKTQWTSKFANWRKGIIEATSDSALICSTCQKHYPKWQGEASHLPDDYPHKLLDFFPVGDLTVELTVPSLKPWDQSRNEDLRSTPISIPALTDFPLKKSMILHCGEDSIASGISIMRFLMARLLQMFPAGKVRFILIDPVGLGQNFAQFMPLADFDDTLITGRIWTESGHIDKQLSELTGHMETVIQEYLRSQYPTIQEYNDQAGEMAEPYRVLVISHFPANFTPDSLRRLASIVHGGSRCGVSALIGLNRTHQFPRDFSLSELEKVAINLDRKNGYFYLRDEDFSNYPLHFEPMPDSSLSPLLRQFGEAAKKARKVEVPFEFIAPTAQEIWKDSSLQGIRVAIGRSGATRKQFLDLGTGTSQHVLIAGKTGSGKSSLLHALITNLALQYSPEEISLYLVDFKKGVEFKSYASSGLPHAKVIAIESEREFGLSVLARLDAELTIRGETFRNAGSSDLPAYRKDHKELALPRILLVVDEFQEFFVEDDRIAQEAARLLDRLVRQGRAFGIHVLMGSQTLGGAYSLARSTIDQMAVRIALQCSEADAHLILSEDNNSARVLNRPGEAIYNDANGRPEGNSLFQVVWLSEKQRETYLEEIRDFAKTQPKRVPATAPIIFEGNALADLEQLLPFQAIIRNKNKDQPGLPSGVMTAWLGEAMAIDRFTAATFQSRNGDNLVIVGQKEEMATGMLKAALLTLLAQTHPVNASSRSASFFILDGQSAQPDKNSPFREFSHAMGSLVEMGSKLELSDILKRIHQEVLRRQQSGEETHAPWFVFLHGLHRFRNLLRDEDEFGFSSQSSSDENPSSMLSIVIKEGPSLGIHFLIWCDTLANLQRVFNRQSMRELTMRVAMQMNVNDSSQLIDSPAASKLGPNRALFSNEEEGVLEKFRPYGSITKNQIQAVADFLSLS